MMAVKTELLNSLGNMLHNLHNNNVKTFLSPCYNKITKPNSYLFSQLVKCFHVSRPARRFCSKVGESIENKPIKFSTSPAAQKTTVPVMRRPVTITMPWYQPYSVVGSITVFLIYFCVLREENDIDLEFDKTLYERIKGLEKVQLLQTYKFNKEHGKSVTEVEQRLKEIEAEENKLVV